jgi:formate hydrogenlyase subunit 4
MNTLLSVILALVFVPLIIGFLKGIDRKITARMQGRIGPPVMQPFYDVIKLWTKDRMVAYRTHVLWAYACLGFIMAALAIFVWGQDILMMLFVLAIGGICLVLGALSIKSPYSHFGGNRELIQMLAYEPILFLVALAIFVATGSFNVSKVFSLPEPLLFTLPLAFCALVIVLIVKTRKSPFDISFSHHAHQEIVRGPVTEFSGRYLALIELAEWYETALILGLMAIFWANNIWPGIIITLVAYFLVMLIDNITARLTWNILLKFSWTLGIDLVILNLLGLFLVNKLGF